MAYILIGLIQGRDRHNKPINNTTICTKYTTCGNKHLPRWKTSKQRRNRKGQYERGPFVYVVSFMIVSLFIGGSFLGVNTIVNGFKKLEKIIIVSKAEAVETITNLTWQEEIHRMWSKAGIDIEKAEKLIACESSNKRDAVHHNPGSTDYGLYQINNKYHPEVSKTCALDYLCSTKEFIRIVKQKGWNEWSCYAKGLIK